MVPVRFGRGCIPRCRPSACQNCDHCVLFDHRVTGLTGRLAISWVELRHFTLALPDCLADLTLAAICCRVISDDKESNSGKDDRGKLKTVRRKVKHLFGKADKEEENQAADFVEDDAQGELCMF